MSQNIQPDTNNIDLSWEVQEAYTKANKFILTINLNLGPEDYPSMDQLIEIQEAALAAERSLGRARRAIMAAINKVNEAN